MILEPIKSDSAIIQPENHGFYLCKTPTAAIAQWEVLWWNGCNWKLGTHTLGCLSPNQQRGIKEVYGPLSENSE